MSEVSTTLDCDALLLDLDGVLVDVQDWHDRALERAIWDAGIRKPVDIDGRRSRNVIDAMIHPSQDVEPIYAAKWMHLERIAHDVWAARRPFYDAVPAPWWSDVHFRLQALDCPIAVVTDTPRDAAWWIIRAEFGKSPEEMGWRLFARASCHEVEKPDPWLYAHATASLDVEPGRCLAVEDSDRGEAAALAAGVGEVKRIKHPVHLQNWLRQKVTI